MQRQYPDESEEDERSLLRDPAARPDWSPEERKPEQHLSEMACWVEPSHADD